jgi:hypothetical protein
MSDLNPYEEGLAVDLAAAQARIEELEAQRNFAQRQVVAAETKLARAVDTLMFYGGVMPNAFLPIQDGGEKARTTLAELKGETDD